MRSFYKHDTIDCRLRATIKTTILRQRHGTICIVKVFLLSESEISPNCTGTFLDFVHRLGSYVKGLLKTKRCNLVAVTVSVRIVCIGETFLRVLLLSMPVFRICIQHMAYKGTTTYVT